MIKSKRKEGRWSLKVNRKLDAEQVFAIVILQFPLHNQLQLKRTKQVWAHISSVQDRYDSVVVVYIHQFILSLNKQ